MSLIAAGLIHIPPSRHTDLSLADWTRLSFASGVSGKKTTVVLSNVVAKISMIEQQNCTHTLKNKHNLAYTHIYVLI